MKWAKGRGGTVTFVTMGIVTTGIVWYIHQSQVSPMLPVDASERL